jgi:membrane protein implicated in regulation of membrane protease activity
MTLLGGDLDSADIDVDMEMDTDTGIGFQYLSIKNLVGFFTIFGWTGIACLASGKSMAFTVIVSVLAGLLMMTIMSTIVYLMGKLTEQGNLNLQNAIGKIATAYLTIPAERKGMGKIQVKVQGFRTLDAITDEKEDIKTGAVVEVVDVINNQVLLVKHSK